MKITDIHEVKTKQDGDSKGVVNTSSQEDEVETYQNLGTYIALSVDRLSGKKIRNFAEDYGISSPVPEDELHCTLFSTKNFIKGFKPQGVLLEPYMINGFELEVWPMDNGNSALVAKFESQAIESRHKAIREEFPEAEPTHAEFIPHVTISYEADSEGNYDLERLSYYFNVYVDYVSLNQEYVEPLNTEDSD